jgi:hypothetical protein
MTMSTLDGSARGRPRLLLLLGVVALGCSDRGGTRPHAETISPAQPSPRAEAATFTVALPVGYEEVAAGLEKRPEARYPPVVLAANETRRGLRPTITLQNTPVPGGTMADPAECRRAAEGLAGDDWRLRSASIIDGPVGKTCQIELLAPEGVALITELNRPNETWLMTCNHADGDAEAERVCRSTLASFRFKDREGEIIALRAFTISQQGRPIARLHADGRSEGTEPDASGRPARFVPGPTFHADGTIILTKGGFTARVEAGGDIYVVSPPSQGSREHLFGRIAGDELRLATSDLPWAVRIEGNTIRFHGPGFPNQIDGAVDDSLRRTALVMTAAFFIDMSISGP